MATKGSFNRPLWWRSPIEDVVRARMDGDVVTECAWGWAAMCTVRATGLTETSDKIDLVVAAVGVSSRGLHATL